MINYRIASIEDLTELEKLDVIFWQERQTIMPAAYLHTEAAMPKDVMLSRITGENNRVFLALSENRIVGYLMAKFQINSLPCSAEEIEGRICDLFVLPEYRNRGIATNLYKYASDWFDTNNCVTEGLTVYSENPALSIYRSWGYSSFSLNMRKRRDIPDCHIRKMKFDDIDSVCFFLYDCYVALSQKEGYAPIIAEKLIEARGSKDSITKQMQHCDFYVSCYSDKIVGLVSIYQNEIDKLFVSPDCQGQNIGRTLFKRACKIIAENGYDKLELGSFPSAVGFYCRMGMRYHRTKVIDKGPLKGHQQPLMTMELSRRNLVANAD